MPRAWTDIRTSSAALGAALLVSLLGLLACVGVPSARADAAQVTVVFTDGGSRTLSLEALAGKEDVVGKGYVLRGGGGESTETVTGFSLETLIDAAGADPYKFSYLEVQRPGGGSVLLDNQEARETSNGPPVVYATAGGTAFLRPSGGAGDLNADDSFSAPQGITLVLHDEPLLQVEAKASTLRTKPGESVDFTAVVKRAGAGEQLTYSWTFEGGGRASGPEATHEFAEAGSFKVVLGVQTPANPTGASDVLTIQVGAPSKGPDRQGGGKTERDDAPEHGLADGPGTGTSEGSGAGTLPSVGAGSEEATTPAPAPEPTEPTETAPEPEGEEVRGELLTGTTTTSPTQEQQLAEARSGSLDDSNGGGEGGVPAAAWGGLATLGLLGLGGLLEARGLGGLLPARRRGGIA